MSNLSDFLGGAKPKLITRYTSGTGTHVPTVDMARCLVRVQGGGGGGGSAAQPGGGGGGAMVEFWTRIPIAGETYIVGAAAAAVTPGNVSKFGKIVAAGGGNGQSNGVYIPGAGGVAGLSGVNGGGGASNPILTGAPGSVALVGSSGNSGGGDSFFGSGGPSAAGAGANGTGYGAGGGGYSGGGGTGSGGLIEIWDFGA